jgi:hypothetical protein
VNEPPEMTPEQARRVLALLGLESAATEVAAAAPAPSKDLLREHLDVLAPLAAAITNRSR